MSIKQPLQIQREEHDDVQLAKKVRNVSNVTVVQGTDPWATSFTGNLTIDSGNISIVGNVTVEQGDNPWVISNLGNVTVEQGDNPWVTSNTGNITVEQGDDPWNVNTELIQYTEDDVDATIVGNALMLERSGNVLKAAKDDTGFGENLTTGILSAHNRLWDGSAYDRAPGNSTDGALVNLGSNNDISVVGNVTVEQGDDPWVTSNVGNLTVEQGDDPWNVAAVGNVTLSDAKTYIGLATVTIGSNAVSGPGDPSIDSVTQFAINLGAAADQVLVSSAVNKQIWVYAVAYTLSVAGTVSFQDEDNVAITGIMDHAANSGLSMGPSGNFAMPIWKLATNKDLEVDVVTAAIDGFITYAIVSV